MTDRVRRGPTRVHYALMAGRRARVLWGVAALGPVLVVATFVALHAAGAPLPAGEQAIRDLYPNAVFGTLMPLLGALVLTRIPGHRVGSLFLACGLACALTLAVWPYAEVGLASGWPGALGAAWVSEWVWGLGFMPLVTLAVLLFPSGRPPSPRWRPLVWVDLASVALGFLAHGFHPGPLENHSAAVNPLGLPLPEGVFAGLGVCSLALFVVGLLGAAVSVASRWRRGSRGERTQLVWFLASVLTLVTAVLGPFGSATGDVLVLVAVPALPVSVAAAILRHHLYGIEPIVRRSLVYGSLTALLLLGYAAIVTSIEAVMRGHAAAAGTLAGTAAVAVAFAPLRSRLQAATDRLIYGQSNDPYAVLSGVGRRLERTGADDDATLAEVADSLAASLRLPYVRVEIDADEPLAATWGTAPAGVTSLSLVPLSFRGRRLGRIVAAPRSPADPLRAADLRLLDDIGRQVGVAAHAMLLTRALQRSREAIVATREEERRRLRRDLHDGLGPTLAGVALGLDALRRVAASNARQVVDLADQLKVEVHAALADVRRLVDGLRPPALDELGLVGAVRRQADVLTERDPGLLVDVEVATEVPARLPAAVEVAAYRIATEALTNIARHAHARTCRVGFEIGTTGELVIEVEDDGVGLPATTRPGVGLAAMRERATELGGSVSAETGPRGGTRVLARLPLAGATSTDLASSTPGDPAHLTAPSPERHVPPAVDADRAGAPAALT